jgi:DNA-binding response OmpR family regulator
MKILLIEADKKIANFIARNFEEEGYEIEIVNNHEEGIQISTEEVYGLVIFDLTMPNKDRISILISKLRHKFHHKPIMILSDSNAIEDIVDSLDAGADDYLLKPFSLPEFLARVKSLLRRSSQERGAKVYFSDLCLDPVEHTAWRNGKEIELTAKEYELLEYLMRHPKQTVTRNMIADAVWEGGFDRFTNIIDVYVNYLRKKIDRGHDTKLIHTIRGIGYMLTNEK